ncbi:MAG: hypothetical protein A2173_07425 [Planctomycetes bacterium RBG_13_44_8b]|nr:MAG: hypothetical protein A2173_07425 [Planctomycetes bacterium RBG_13_44_8b]
MNTEQMLQRANRAVKFKRAKTKKTFGITPELKQFVRQVARPANRGALIAEAFKSAAGSGLAENCRIESFRSGVLEIKVRPGPYMFELRKQSAEIVGEIRMRYPSSYIREIKIVCLEQ